MSTAKTSARRTRKAAVRTTKTKSLPLEATSPKWSMEERAVDPDAPYYGLSKEEFERLAFWRKIPLSPALDQAMDLYFANRDRIRAETINHDDHPSMD